MNKIRFLLGFLMAAALAVLPGQGCKGGDGTTPPPPGPCSLTMVAPQAGASFDSNDQANIRWEKEGEADSVMITLLQGGTQAGLISAGTENDGFFPWNADVMTGHGGDFVIRVTALGQNDCVAESGTFTILNTAACNITMTGTILPDTFLVEGQTVPLTWDSHDTKGGIGIELRHGHLNNVLVGTIAEFTPDDGSFDWTADSFNDAAHRPVSDNSVYWVRIFDEDVPGCEDHSVDFSLFDSNLCTIDLWVTPSQQSYAMGDTLLIGFDVSDYEPGDLVKIRLYAGSIPVPQGYITVPGEDLPANSVTPYKWAVDNYGYLQGGSHFKVRVSKVDDIYCWGQSEEFEILN